MSNLRNKLVELADKGSRVEILGYSTPEDSSYALIGDFITQPKRGGDRFVVHRNGYHHTEVVMDEIILIRVVCEKVVFCKSGFEHIIKDRNALDVQSKFNKGNTNK